MVGTKSTITFKLAAAIVSACTVAASRSTTSFVSQFRRTASSLSSSAPAKYTEAEGMVNIKSRSMEMSCSAHNTNEDMVIDESLAVGALLQRAHNVRAKLYQDNYSAAATDLPSYIQDVSQLSYPSSVYNMETDNSILNTNKNKVVQRGFCNWLIPQTIMIGQYPGMTPETNGPSSNECQLHIQNTVQDAGISLFCCLQTEVPSQEDEVGWNKDGKDEVYLEPYHRRDFPRPFTRYGPLAQSFAKDTSSLSFLHKPIEDLSVPTCNRSMLALLSTLLQHLEHENQAIYLHCWGGRGRAGLIGSCLASLLFPELSSRDILDWVQRGYDTRMGAANMQGGLKRSPQTEQQRLFVREFVDIVHSERDCNMI